MFRLILVLLAAAAVAGQLIQERMRLASIAKLPAEQALARYEAARRNGMRGMMILTVVAAAVGLVAMADLVITNVTGASR